MASRSDRSRSRDRSRSPRPRPVLLPPRPVLLPANEDECQVTYWMLAAAVAVGVALREAENASRAAAWSTQAARATQNHLLRLYWELRRQRYNPQEEQTPINQGQDSSSERKGAGRGQHQ